MSEDGINSPLAGAQQNIAQELMEEDLKRELARNELATKMAMAKEHEAQEAKRRAMGAQEMMVAMMEKYELMKNKLDGARTALAETADKTQAKEEVITKISAMRERIENYSNRKEAVNFLEDHVRIKLENQSSGMEFLQAAQEETEKYTRVAQFEEEKAERVAALQQLMKEREKALERTEMTKQMLEKQFLLGEKKIAEKNRIADVREKMLELKMKELELQKAKFARMKREQEEKERATEDFIAMIDKQLEDMESGTLDPKEKSIKISEIIEKHFNDEEKKEGQAAKTGAVPKQTPKQSKATAATKVKSGTPEKKKAQEVNVDSPKPVEPVKGKSPAPSKNKKKNKNKNKSKSAGETEASVEVPAEKAATPKVENVTSQEISKPVQKEETKPVKTAEQIKKDIAAYLEKSKKAQQVHEEMEEKKNVVEPDDCEKKLTEDEVKSMVARVEGKCETMRGDIADMAMSEQYLRTKQALLKAKKREQEMQIAQNIASLREEEVIKMKEKVEKMQELLQSRREKLKVTEEIMNEKDGAKQALDKRIEASLRRQNFVEKKIIEKVMFEKPKKKKE